MIGNRTINGNSWVSLFYASHFILYFVWPRRRAKLDMTCIYESRGGGGLSVAYRPQRMRKNIKASLVNLTLNVRYKNDKKYQICHHHIRFSSSKCTKIRSFSAGARPRTPLRDLSTLPDPLVGWGGDTPSSFPININIINRTCRNWTTFSHIVSL